MSDFYMGLDLGQARDFTALCILEKKEKKIGSEWQSTYECGYLERMPRGTLYPAVVEHVKALMKSPVLRNASLAVDATGVGRPVVDMLRDAGLSLTAVTITGGSATTRVDGMTNVPKRELVSILQVLLQSERLGFSAAVPDTQTLVQELDAFQVKITDSANDTYGSWRTGTHDDLVLAVAIAAWEAENNTNEVWSF